MLTSELVTLLFSAVDLFRVESRTVLFDAVLFSRAVLLILESPACDEARLELSMLVFMAPDIIRELLSICELSVALVLIVDALTLLACKVELITADELTTLRITLQLYRVLFETELALTMQ